MFLQEFLTTIKEDDVCKYVVHLAICMTKTEVEEKAMELLTPQKIVIDSDEDAEHKMGVSKPPPRKGMTCIGISNDFKFIVVRTL